jgi:hypothetical protein
MTVQLAAWLAALPAPQPTAQRAVARRSTMQAVHDLLPAKIGIGTFCGLAHAMGVEERLEHLVATHKLVN